MATAVRNYLIDIEKFDLEAWEDEWVGSDDQDGG